MECVENFYSVEHYVVLQYTIQKMNVIKKVHIHFAANIVNFQTDKK